MSMAPDSNPLLDSVTGDHPDPSPSLELARRAQAGDPQALDELLRRYQEPLRRIVRIRLGARLRHYTESMDIVQNTYLVASRKIAELELEDPAALLKWLAKIATHQIHDEAKRQSAQKRDGGREVALEDVGRPTESSSRARHDPAASDTLPVDRALKNELKSIVDEEISKLPERFREVILLRDYHQGDWEFVAREVDAPTAHAAAQLYQRAWIKLRAAVRPRIPGVP